MSKTINWKETLYIIFRQFAYLIIFILLFFWANILTIFSLILSFFKQPLNERELKEIYTKNFSKIDKLL